MKTKKVWANFSVGDLDRTTKFYKQLGFKHNGASDQLTSFSLAMKTLSFISF